MAKTIKKLALEAYPIKIVKSCGPLPGGGISEKDENLLERMAMEKGANAVLEYIKEVANNCSDITLLTVIKELEGE